MPFDYEAFARKVNRGDQQPQPEPPAPAPEYNVPQPPATRQEAIQPMKNYELLTRPERGLFERILPGVRGSWAGSAMNWVANNPVASKILPWLDIFAEGVERTSGLMNQMEYYKDDVEGAKHLFQNLSETWKASSLNYNFADLPQLVLSDDIATEGIYKGSNVRGLRLPDDMPGVEGLNRAREMMIAGASMEEVEAAFEEEMGALWMRGQMYDMYGHIFLDPLNYLMPLLAPIKKSALASRINKVTRISNVADDIIIEATELLAKAIDKGNAADVYKYTEILKGQEGLTTWEKIGDFLGGGRELLPDEALKAPTDANWLRRTAADVELAARKGVKVKGKKVLPSAPHTLTPASRGNEAATVVNDGIRTHIFQQGQNYLEKNEGLKLFEEGALSGVYGHYFLTPEGKFVGGLLHGVSAVGDFRTHQYDALLKSGIVDELGAMANALDTTVDDIATALVHGKGVDEIAEALGKNVDELGAMGDYLKGAPYSEKTWELAVADDVGDLVEQASIAMYGVQQRGKLQALSGAVKSAETLAWLKLNPSFPIKNYFTDEAIMVAQGVTGKMNAANIDDYWKVMGFDSLPQRVKQGIGMAGLEGGEVTGRGVGPLAEATMGKPGWLAKFSKKINDVNLGPLDMATAAQKIESKHSAQAFTVWHQKAMNRFNVAGVGFDPIETVVSPKTLELMEAAEPGLARKFNNWASSAMGKKSLDDFQDVNLNLAMDEILEEARVVLGYDVDLKKALPEEYLINLKVGLPEAAAKGRIPQYIGKFKRDLQQHLDDLAVDLTQRTAERAATQAKAEGPQSWYKMYVAVIDDLQSSHVAQAVEAAKIEDLLRGANKAAAGQFWAKRLPDVEQTWERIWGRTSAMLKGIRQGTDGALPKRVVELFDTRVSGWKKFYKTRNSDYKKFFDARKAGKTPPEPWDTMKAKHNMMYLDEIEKEASYLDEMAEIVGARLDDPAQQKLFRNMNDTLRESRLADKQSVIQYQEDLINAPSAAARQRIHDEFWSNRYASETHTYEQAANAAMQGNKEAAERFAPRVGEIAEEAIPPGGAAPTELNVYMTPDDVEYSSARYLGSKKEPGVLIAGQSATADDLPDTLYHVTTRGDAVESSGTLTAGATMEGGGLGGTAGGEAVWFTKNLDDAKLFQHDLERVVDIANGKIGVDDFESLARADEVYFGLEPNSLDVAVSDARMFIESNADTGTAPNQFMKEAYDRYLWGRDSAGGKNPLIMGYVESWEGLNKGQIRIIEVPKQSLFESGALVRHKTTTSDFLEEVAVHGDVPLSQPAPLGKAAEAGELAPLQRLAKRYDDFDEFADDYTMKNYHGSYWHLTDDPDFVFDAQKAPRDMSSLASGSIEGKEPGFMVSTDIENWAEQLPDRKYAALVELTDKPGVGYKTTTRGFGHEIYVNDMSKVNVLEVMPVEEAIERQLNLYDNLLPGSKKALREIWDEARGVAPATTAAEAGAAAGKPKTYLPDINQFWPEEMPIALAQDQFWFNRGFLYIDAVEQAALAQAAKKPLKIAKVLPKEAIDEITSWAGQTKAKYGDISNAAVRMGEYGRDAALLNYSRRYNYNTWLGTVAPYEFWMTQSMMKWALHSIDHPAMLSTYWRYQKMMETVGAPNQQIPGRLRDHFKVDLPFLPDWMGNSIWANPARLLLPFEQYSYPFEEWNKRIRSKEGKAEYTINEWVESGRITQTQAEDAIEQQGGDLWRMAIDEVEGENSELRTGPFDFATIFASPHAPIMWAYHAMNDETEKISPIMPLTRYSKAAQGLLGPGIAGDIAGIPHQVEAKVRTTLGLPAFDAWDTYRVERMMTNLAGEGKYPYEEVMRQWIAQEGPIWDEAKMLSDKEFGVSGMASAIGLSLKAYPPGEKKQRLLQTELRNAWDMKEANPDAEVDPVHQFYEKHPEYNARQALWKEPEERMRSFMFDLLYDKWNNMSTIHRRQVKEVIGDDINSVLYPDDAEQGKVIKEEIPIGILQNWLMTMGGDVPGEKQDFAMPVEFIDPKIANRAQVYYDSMSYLHPDFWDVSNEYYEVPENLRRAWGKKNPEKYSVMKAGWDFKRDWLWRNPDVAPYITDNESWYRQFSTLQERDEALAQTPNFNPAELIAAMPQEAQRLVYDFVYSGADIPEPVEMMLEEMAQGMGISLDELLDMLVDNR